MKKYVLLWLVIPLLNACNTTKNWQGTSNPNGTRAEFDMLNGSQTFTMLVPDDDTYLKYDFRVNSGKLEATIASSMEVVMRKELGAFQSDSIHLVNQKGTAYKVCLKGRQASGGFDVKFANGTGESK